MGKHRSAASHGSSVQEEHGSPFADEAFVPLPALQRLIHIHHIDKFLVDVPQQRQPCMRHAWSKRAVLSRELFESTLVVSGKMWHPPETSCRLCSHFAGCHTVPACMVRQVLLRKSSL